MMPPQNRSHRFLLEIDRTRVGSFESMDNLSGELEVLEYRDGGDPVPRKLPGGARYGDLTLRRGAFEGRTLWDWWQATRDGGPKRRTAIVTLADENGKAISRWQLSGCWPARWRFGGGPADPKGFTMVEEITLVIERIEWLP